MADTNVDKNKTSTRTWVILAIIIIVLILYFVFRTTGDKNPPVNNSGTTKVEPKKDAQQPFLNACQWVAAGLQPQHQGAC